MTDEWRDEIPEPDRAEEQKEKEQQEERNDIDVNDVRYGMKGI